MVNCNMCKFMVSEQFTCISSCSKLKCGCHKESSDFFLEVGKPVPRLIPDLGEEKCPGFESAWEVRING